MRRDSEGAVLPTMSVQIDSPHHRRWVCILGDYPFRPVSCLTQRAGRCSVLAVFVPWGTSPVAHDRAPDPDFLWTVDWTWRPSQLACTIPGPESSVFGCGGRLKTSAHVDTTTDVEVLQEGVENGCQEVRVKPLTAAADAVVGRSPTGQQALALEHMLTGPPVLSGTYL
jgi:hypothetical protein